MKQAAPFGSWPSPISIELLLTGELRLAAPRWDGADLYWIEGRPDEDGRQVVVTRSDGGAVSDVTPRGFNARTRVHEYGGGDYAVRDGIVWFTNFDDQRVYRQDPREAPRAISPEGDIRHADLLVDSARKRVLAVREDHSRGEGEAVNSLVSLDADGKGDALVLASGGDFYSTPRLSADGRRLAWLTWNHPNMPWDGTELWVAELDADGAVASKRKVAGGPSESICQPEWGPSGELYFISDRTGWWNLYSARGHRDEALCRMDEEFGGPQWIFGRSHYQVLSENEILCIHSRSNVFKLSRLDLRTSELSPVKLLYSFLDNVQVTGRKAAVLAASPTLSLRVLTVDLDSAAEEVVRTTVTKHVDPNHFSIPKPIEFATEGGVNAHAWYYPPRNADFEGPPGAKPPLVVHSHGGPTSAVLPVYNLEFQYWTSRGFALVDVNYRGSTGYGRAYRDMLRGQWGVADVDDCIGAARHLVDGGLADPDHIAITGGSAGGFTTLLSLTKRDFFHAGASHFGVGDLESFRTETHKFESRYLETLVGPYPQRADVYRERSAVNFADGLSCPIILFQGLDDSVVPPDQAEEFVAACKAKKLPYAYIAFEGEQHGFRRAPNIRRSIDAEFYFYSRIFGFEPADAIEPVTIENF
ncbi:MAG TPA: prolyl oligopeptidase family serine peptidase [Candidatus Dormibacteraeota bacterium]|nr:prolyl oligopeptidase family serine peptidase [Candidatus Dormibacteraeota bacterium]